MNDERMMGVAEMIEDAYLDELADRLEYAAEVGVTVHQEPVQFYWGPAQNILWSTDPSYWTPATKYGLAAALWTLRAWAMSQR
jgi:hypothetical protein